MVIGVPSSLMRLRSPIPPGSPAFSAGYRSGQVLACVLLVGGLFLNERWYISLGGHTHKVGSQAWASIFFWYSILGILIGLFIMLRSTFSARSGEGMATVERIYTEGLRPIPYVICGVVGFACGIWKERLRASEKTIQASAQARVI